MTVDYEIYKEGGILKDRYQKIEDISEGSYGYVSLAKDLKEKKLVAVKYIFKLDEDEDRSDNYDSDKNYSDRNYDSSQEKFHVQNKSTNKNTDKSLISSNIKSKMSNDVCFEAMYEVDIQTKIGKHNNIVQLLDFFDSYIILEYCTGGDLYEAIKDDIVPRSTNAITHIISQILDAVEYVHNKHIYHRDIKPENILITGIDWTIKLTDWGLATTNKTSMDRSIGSERYMAPELFESNLDLEERKEPYHCDKVDLWAMGIVFLNIVFHKNPFSVANQSDKSFCYFAANREALFDVFSSMTYDFFQVLRYCLTIDPMNRDLKQIRVELDNLNEYTFDDEYYNNLEEEEEENYGYGSSGTEYDTEVSESASNAVQPPVSLPTPVGSLKPSNDTKNQSIDVDMDKSAASIDNNNTVATAVAANNIEIKEKIKDSTSQLISQNNNSNQHLEIPTSYAVQDNLHDHHTNPNNKGSHKNDPSDISKSNTKFKYSSNNKKNRGKKKNNGRYHIKPIQIRNRNKSKIIKNSRKPLGIPTPNTHINNFFHDYKKNKDKSNFNTRDFFTPPSVQNRYMEGVFDHKYRKNKSKYYLTTNTNNNNINPHGIYGANKGWHSSYNQNNGLSNSFKYNKFRRPSTTGNSGYNVSTLKSSHGQRNSFNNGSLTSGFFRRSSLTTHSPGAYIPPNQRNSISHASGNSPLPNLAYASLSTYNNIPDISTVLDNGHYNNSPGSVNSHNSRDSSSISSRNYNNNNSYDNNDSNHNNINNLRKNNSHELSILNDDGHESDDALFTLDENDSDLVKNFNSLSINSGTAHMGMMSHDHIHDNGNTANIAGHDLLNVPSSNSVPSVLVSQHFSTSDESTVSNTLGRLVTKGGTPSVTNDYLPDLLKSPVTNEIHHDDMVNSLVNNNYNQPINGGVLHRSSFGDNHSKTFKPGVYIPPHHRRASMNQQSSSSPPYEHVLNVSNNQISYDNNFNEKNNEKKNTADNSHDKIQSFNILMNPSQSTTSLQNEYAFADSNTEAIIFEEDEEVASNNGRTVFGPYEIYDNKSDYDKLNKFRAGRKSTTLQDEIVGSLEQYKNNWLLQQQSQQEEII
ncbi:hypothetical protein RI543_000863 [Arxiozyma heterogenica]|uniref:Protein kinase domain-containing protein n=1 Tax=Arxiozyma heterogenica TaxID=278026 RepID=A0AAN7WQH9_9SACH|nr:hypothetical protein RI543_000863 [Kazachstania heterogenica]